MSLSTKLAYFTEAVKKKFSEQVKPNIIKWPSVYMQYLYIYVTQKAIQWKFST